MEALPALPRLEPPPVIVHQTGAEDFEGVAEAYRRQHGLGRHDVLPFLDDMPARLAEASLAICRAGATTLAELAAAGRPAILTVHRFSPALVADLRREVLPALKDQKIPLVVDLRYCQEGEFDQAREFVNLFVKAAEAGYFEKRNGLKQAVSCPAEPELGTVALAVWVGAGTMGPAEFAAGQFAPNL